MTTGGSGSDAGREAMSTLKSWQNLTDARRAFPTRGYKAALGVVALTSVVSSLRLSFTLGYKYGVFKSLGGNHTSCCVGFAESYLVTITIGLAVAAIGLWLQRRMWFFLSALASFCVLAAYVLWYFSTQAMLGRMEVEDFFQLPNQGQHMFALLDASWWDLIVLATTTLLFIWQLRALLVVNRAVR